MQNLKLWKEKKIYLIFLFLLWGSINITTPVHADIPVSGSISQDTTWADTTQPYVISGAVSIDHNATLTILPGVTVYINTYGSIRIGGMFTGTLIAEGTAGNPILFTGNKAAPWTSIGFTANAGQTSILKHCVIENGGVGFGTPSALVTLQNSHPSISDCTFKNSAGYPIIFQSPDALAAITGTSIFIANKDNRAAWGGTGYFTSDSIIRDPGTPYFFKASLSVYENATMTIEPGVELQFGKGAVIGVGSANSTGTLVAEGTAEKPIIFTSDGADPWCRLTFTRGTGQGTRLNHCIIENGGAYNYPMVDITTPHLSIQNCTFKNSADYPMIINTPDVINTIDGSNRFMGNNDNRIVLGGILTTDARIQDPGIPYSLGLGTVNDVTLTIDPGVELQFGFRSTLTIGQTGTLIARGTAANPILFTNGDATPWGAVDLLDNSGEKSVLSHCIIENGGYDKAGLLKAGASNLMIEYCTIRNSAGSGLHLYNDALPVLIANRYENNQTYPIGVESGESLSAIDKTGTYSGNGDNRISVADRYIETDTTIIDAGVPFLFSLPVNVRNNATLTIQPGTILHMTHWISLGYGGAATGTLLAEGTPANPIVFTCASPQPAPGQWTGLYFTQFDGGSRLSNAIIEYGTTNIDINGPCSPVIKGCTIRHASETGMNIDRYATPDISCNTITANETGIYVHGDSEPRINHNNFYDNTTGLLCYMQNAYVNAENNYWGSAQGPEIGTGTGNGDTIINNCGAGSMDYTPWLSSPASCTAPLNAGMTGTPLSGSEDLTVSFFDNSTGPVGSWEWDFGDQTINFEQHPVHTYTEPGEYTARLTVWEIDANNHLINPDSTTALISVSESVPTAAFTPDTPLAGRPPLTIEFTDTSTTSGTEDIVSWEWDFNADGIVDSRLPNPLMVFDEDGNYTVSLTVTDEDGDVDSVFIPALIQVNTGFQGDLDDDRDVDGSDLIIFCTQLADGTNQIDLIHVANDFGK